MKRQINLRFVFNHKDMNYMTFISTVLNISNGY